MTYIQSDKLIEYLTKVNEIPEPVKNKKDIKGLSPKTKKGYINKLGEFEKDLYKATGLYIEDALTTNDAQKIWDKLILNPSYNLIKKQAIISALNSIYKYILLNITKNETLENSNEILENPNDKKYEKSYYSWAIIKKEVYESAKKKALSNEATDKQNETYIDWETIKKTRDLIGKQKFNPFDNTGYGSDIHLVMALYTYSEYGVYPGRADYYNVEIHKKMPDEAILSKGNHIIVTSKDSLIYLNDYKTSKTYGVHKYELPDIVHKIIKANIKNYNMRYANKGYGDKKYLLMNTEGKKFSSSGAYCMWFERTLEKVFKKNVGVNAIRHSYLSSEEYGKKNTYEKEKIAKYMKHSVKMAMSYKYNNVGGNSEVETDIEEENEILDN
jgi:hypothetical protein